MWVRVRLVLAAVVAVVISFAASPAATAADHTIDSGQELHDVLAKAKEQGAEWHAVGPNGEVFSPANSTDATPLVDPIDRLMCANDVSDHMVNDWIMDHYMLEGQVRLNCGEWDTAGYNHIEYGHRLEWQNIMPGGAAGGGVWDDFMEFVIGATLTAPETWTDEGNNKLCFDTLIQIVVDDQVWDYYWPVIVSENNRIVITTYPGLPCYYR